MTLQETITARAHVLAYLEACKRQAETDLNKDGLSDDAWHNAARVFARCNADLIAARRGDGWRRFYTQAMKWEA